MATLEDLHAAARRALAPLDLLVARIPARDRDNPREVAEWLRAAAQMNLRAVEHDGAPAIAWVPLRP